MSRILVVSVLGVAAWWMWPGQDQDHVPGRLQAAVLPDGFAVIDGERHRIVEVDDDGTQRDDHAIDELPADTRVFGWSTGVGVAWHDGKRIAVAAIDELEQPQRFGKRAHHLCDGTASSAVRFGVAWTEHDGTVWFVHGPTDLAQLAGATEVSAKQPAYCGIASGGDQLVLLWRDGARTFMNRCKRECPSSATRVALDAKRAILGFGCTADACVIATRNEQHTIEATWVDRKGSLVWTRPLPSADRDTAVTIVGAGARIAIAYSLGSDPLVTLGDRAGTLQPIWQGGADPGSVPGLAWSHDTLLVAHQRDGRIATAVVRP